MPFDRIRPQVQIFVWEKIYGRPLTSFVTFARSSKKFGLLFIITCFKYENFNGISKKYVMDLTILINNVKKSGTYWQKLQSQDIILLQLVVIKVKKQNLLQIYYNHLEKKILFDGLKTHIFNGLLKKMFTLKQKMLHYLNKPIFYVSSFIITLFIQALLKYLYQIM